jgi:hypothetical protein
MKWNTPFHVVTSLVLVGFLWLLGDHSPTCAKGPTLYELAESSNFQEGCFDPCLCPILMNETLHGTLVLNPLIQGTDNSLFEVLEVAWQFSQGGEVIPVTGAGIYRIYSEQHRMTMDLKIGESPLQHFDSGLVPRVSEYSEIIIAIAVNGFYCYDTAFFFAALPTSVTSFDSTWGRLKSIYR